MNDERLRQDPFVLPEGYIAEVEESLRKKIHRPLSGMSVFIGKVKPAFMLVLVFAVIGGFGYGVRKLTEAVYGTVSYEDGFMALIEEGYIDPEFIYYVSDEINVGEALDSSLEKTVYVDEIMTGDLVASMTQNEVEEYIVSRNND